VRPNRGGPCGARRRARHQHQQWQARGAFARDGEQAGAVRKIGPTAKGQRLRRRRGARTELVAMTATLPATRGNLGALPVAAAASSQLGLMVCDPRGRVVAANARLKEIVPPDAGGWDSSAKCCTVLGCGRTEGALDGACLTERSLAAGE